MDMAVGVIIGGAFTGIVTALTTNFINPLLSLISPAAPATFPTVWHGRSARRLRRS